MADTIPTVAETAQFVDDTLRGEVDPNGTGAYNSRPGSDNAVLVSTITKVATRAYAYAADRKKASITATSEDTDLDDNVRDKYFDARKDANAAVGTLYLKRLAGPLAATTIDMGWRAGTDSSGSSQVVEFEASETVPVASGVAAVAVPIRCLQDGEIGNVDLLSISQKLDPLDDSNWQIYIPTFGDDVLAGASGPDVVGGGTERESDDELKSRVLQRPAKAAPGTASGVYQGATDVPGVATAVPIEVGDGTGVVYAGDPNFLLPSAMKAAIATALEDWRPWGVPAAVRAMNLLTEQVTARVYMQQALKNYDVSALRANAVAAVTRYFATERKRPDEYFLDAIKTAIAKANQETQSVALDSPGADVRRPSDASYGAEVALNRYRVTDATINIQFFDPLTS